MESEEYNIIERTFDRKNLKNFSAAQKMPVFISLRDA